MELMLASQLHSTSRSFLADRALRLETANLLQLLVFLIRYWSALIFLLTQVDKPDECNCTHREESRHDDGHGSDEADRDDSPFFLTIGLLLGWLLGLGLSRDSEWNILSRVVLITHFLNDL